MRFSPAFERNEIQGGLIASFDSSAGAQLSGVRDAWSLWVLIRILRLLS